MDKYQGQRFQVGGSSPFYTQPVTRLQHRNTVGRMRRHRRGGPRAAEPPLPTHSAAQHSQSAHPPAASFHGTCAWFRRPAHSTLQPGVRRGVWWARRWDSWRSHAATTLCRSTTCSTPIQGGDAAVSGGGGNKRGRSALRSPRAHCWTLIHRPTCFHILVAMRLQEQRVTGGRPTWGQPLGEELARCQARHASPSEAGDTVYKLRGAASRQQQAGDGRQHAVAPGWHGSPTEGDRSRRGQGTIHPP